MLTVFRLSVAVFLLACACSSAFAASGHTPPLSGVSPFDKRLAGMSLAASSHKVGAPVKVYYEAMVPAKKGIDPSMRIAVVPDVDTDGLHVELVPDKGVTIAAGAAPMVLQKSNAGAVYQRFLAASNSSNQTGRIRVIASVRVGGARVMSIFLVPIEQTGNQTDSARAKGSKPTRKQPSL